MSGTVCDKFYENDVKPLLKATLSRLEEDFQQNKEMLKMEFLNSFKDVCIYIKEVERSTGRKAGFIIYNLLRTRMLSKRYEYMVVLYDKDWYLKDGVKVGDLNVQFFYKHFEELWQELLKLYKKYIMQVSVVDVERIMMDQLDSFHKYVVEMMRYSLIDAIETEEYKSLEKEAVMEIQSGEYFEPCDTVHIEHKEKNYIEIIKWLDKKEKGEYCFQDFRGIDLMDRQYQNIDLRYTDLRCSKLDGLDISFSLLMGTKFKSTRMKGANLIFSMISDANFEEADMTGAKLQSCLAFTGKNTVNEWKKVGFTGVSFKNAILKDASFKWANVIGADFEGADLQGAVFEEAKLFRSRFSKEQLEQISLSKEQLEQIEIIK